MAYRKSPRRKSRSKRSTRKSSRRSGRKSPSKKSSLEDRCYLVAGSNFKPLAIKGKSNRDKLVKSLRSKGKIGISSLRVRCRPNYKGTPVKYRV